MARDYHAIAQALRKALSNVPESSLDQRLAMCVDALWPGLHADGVSWLGFYLDQPQQPDERRLVLGPCRDKPACSPIGLHGVCGQALRSQAVRIVSDVKELGARYIACDPRDRSEIVVPLIDDDGRCWAVLDLDSHEPRSFNQDDAVGLQVVLNAAGLVGAAARHIGQPHDGASHPADVDARHAKSKRPAR